MLSALSLPLFLCAALVQAGAALAHEFWIEARDYQVPSGGQIEAGVYNGQNFRGVELAFFEGRIDHALWRDGSAGGGFDSRTGDRPALRIASAPDGLVQLIYQSTPSTLTYKEWEKFTSFVRNKGHDWAIARHLERGLPKIGVRESYTRYCKALVAAGSAAGADGFSGMTHELVALDNPYALPAGQPLRVKLWFRGAPRAGGQIDIFRKPLDGTSGVKATKTHVITDAQGEALIDLAPGYRYLLNAVALEEAEGADFQWVSHWASLTFALPR